MRLEDPLTTAQRAAVLAEYQLAPSAVSVRLVQRDEAVRQGERAWWYLLTDLRTGLRAGTQCLAGRPASSELRFSAAQLAEYLKRARFRHQEATVFNALARLIPRPADTLLLTLARDGDHRWRVNVVPQLAEAALNDAGAPLTLVASLEDLEGGFVEALERFSGATLPLLAQVEAAIEASRAAAETARQRASAKPSARPANTSKASGTTRSASGEPGATTPASTTGAGLFDAPQTEAAPAPESTDPDATRLSELQERLKGELDRLDSEKQVLVGKLNSAALAAFELESAFVAGSEELEPPMRAIPLGKRFLAVQGRIRVLEDRGVEALEEVA